MKGIMRQRPGLILVLGFGGLLLLMAAAEIASLLLLNTLRQNDAQLQARFLARNRTLEQIRSNIYLSGTYVRDSLLAPEATGGCKRSRSMRRCSIRTAYICPGEPGAGRRC